MIELRDVVKRYSGQEAAAVDVAELQVAQGQFVVLVGGSGCGKTTTLKLINRLVEPTAGAIRVGGADVQELDGPQLRRSIGYVFQGIGLFPHMTVAQNVAVVPRLLQWKVAAIQARVEELLELVGLPYAEYAERLPRELSGGQRQRVGVARALASRPKILLMDEPFGALDPITRDQLQRELGQLRRRLELTIVLVTHDMAEALLLADRIAVMNQGKIEQLGSPAQLLREPASDYVRDMVSMPKQQADELEALAREPAL